MGQGNGFHAASNMKHTLNASVQLMSIVNDKYIFESWLKTIQQ